MDKLIEEASRTELIKTFTHDDVRMKVTMLDGDITGIMFHRRVPIEKSNVTMWKHMFSIKGNDLFSYKVVKETLHSLVKLCLVAKDLLSSLGG